MKSRQKGERTLNHPEDWKPDGEFHVAQTAALQQSAASSFSAAYDETGI